MLSSLLDLSGDIINLFFMLLNQAGVDVSALSSK